MRTAQEIKHLIDKAGLGEMTAALAETDAPNARIIPELGILIISKGLVELLSDEEMIAVLLHEKSHLDREDLRSEHINGYELPDIARLRERVADADAVKGLEEMGISKVALRTALVKVTNAIGLDFVAEQELHPSVRERLEAIG